LLYKRQFHNCPEVEDEKDEGFEDYFNMTTILERYQEGDVGFFLTLLKEM